MKAPFFDLKYLKVLFPDVSEKVWSILTLQIKK